MYRGSVVEDGEAVVLVDAVGTNTVFGKLALEMSVEDKREKPLQLKLAALADTIAELANYGAALICVSFLFKQFVIDNHWSWTAMVQYASNWQICIRDVVTSVMLAIIIIVVAVPEGLPMMIAIVLSLNMRKLLSEQVLVRRLLGIETAGCLSVLFVDKTGTLTEGVFNPDRFILGDLSHHRQLGALPTMMRRLAAFVLRESTTASTCDAKTGEIVGGNSTDRAVLKFLIQNASNSNTSAITNNSNSSSSSGRYPSPPSSPVPGSSSTSFSSSSLTVGDEIPGVRIEDEILFSSTRKFSAARVTVPSSSLSAAGLLSGTTDFVFDPNSATGGASGSRYAVTLVKGAAEKIVSNCSSFYHLSANAANSNTANGSESITKSPLDLARRQAIIKEIDRLSSDGARLIAIATSQSPLNTSSPVDDALSTARKSIKVPLKRKDDDKDDGSDSEDEEAKELERQAEAEAEAVRQAGLRAEEENANSMLPRGMTLVGVLSVTDTIRENSRTAVQSAKRAGIQVVMITGDRTETAVAVAKQVGLLPETYNYKPPVSSTPQSSGSSSPVPINRSSPQPTSGDDVDAASLLRWISQQQDIVLTSAQLHKLSSVDVAAIISRVRIIARALPSDKSKLVSLTQSSQAIIAHARRVGGESSSSLSSTPSSTSSSSSSSSSSDSSSFDVEMGVRSSSVSRTSFVNRPSHTDEPESSASDGEGSLLQGSSASPSGLSAAAAASLGSFGSFTGLPALTAGSSSAARHEREAACVVGMTGDGVNDSAALKKADVSFSMGSGSEVAKEASDIVILDDNFQSIIQAVLYGRTIFKSVRKFIVFQCTMNLGTSLIVLLGPFMGFDFPLTLVQLLWVNLIMDTFAALAFGGEPALRRYLDEQPVQRAASIVNTAMLRSMIANGLYIAFSSIIFLTADPIQLLFSRTDPSLSGLHSGLEAAESAAHVTVNAETGATVVHDAAAHETNIELNQQGGLVFLTAFFSYFVFTSTIHAFNVRTHRRNLFQHLSQNQGFSFIIPLILGLQVIFTMLPFAASVLRTVPLTLFEWLVILASSSLIIPFDLLRKTLFPCDENEGDFASAHTNDVGSRQGNQGPIERVLSFFKSEKQDRARD